MRTVSAKKLSVAIEKARGVGLVEERVTMGECEFVLRSLRPDEYDAIIEDTKGLDDIAYVHAYQKAHVCRAIVELNGVDLRETRFVEDEEDDPKKPGTMRRVNLELHAWIDRNVLSTWGREAIFTTYRKLGEVVAEAEKRAKDGITFRTPEETDEEKYRRLLGEVRETEEDLPPDLAVRILGEFSYQHATTEEEVRAAAERLAQVAPEPLPEQPLPEPEAAPEPEPEATGPSPEEVMQARTPLNRVVLPAGRVPQVLNTPPPDLEPASRPLRSAQIADLEGDVAAMPGAAPLPPKPTEVATLERKAAPINAGAAATIFERPPSGGINPRYRPPPKV
jgi:hypothetical protein